MRSVQCGPFLLSACNQGNEDWQLQWLFVNVLNVVLLEVALEGRRAEGSHQHENRLDHLHAFLSVGLVALIDELSELLNTLNSVHQRHLKVQKHHSYRHQFLHLLFRFFCLIRVQG
jgi:hypothetical protein